MNWSIGMANDQSLFWTKGSLWTVKPWASRKPVHQSQSLCSWRLVQCWCWPTGRGRYRVQIQGWIRLIFQEGIMKESSLITAAVIPRVGLWRKLGSSLFQTVSVIFCRCICFKHWPGLLVLHGDSTCLYTHFTASSATPRPTMGYPPSWCHPSCRWKAAPFAELPLLPGIPGDLMEDGGLSAD